MDFIRCHDDVHTWGVLVPLGLLQAQQSGICVTVVQASTTVLDLGQKICRPTAQDYGRRRTPSHNEIGDMTT